MTQDLRRGLPSSIDAEKSILGAILMDNTVYVDAVDLLRPDDFALDSNRRIFLRMMDLGETGRPVELLLLREELAKHKELDAIGGMAYLSSLTDGVPRRPSIAHLARLVKKKSHLRKLIYACNSTIEQALEQIESPASCAAGLHEALLAIEGNVDDSAISHVVQFSDQAYQQLEEHCSHKGELLGLTTGITGLDEATTGIRKNDLWMLAGRTGDGKTTLALQIAWMNAAKQKPVGIFSLEMTKEELLQRIWAQVADVPADAIYRGTLTDEMKAKVRAAMKQVGEWPIYIDDSAGLTVTELSARARLMHKRHCTELIIVDYVQVVEARAKDERQKVTMVSSQLRRIAKEHCAVLTVSQMPRPAGHDPNRRPTKFDLKESGSLENDAKVVVMLYRPVDEHNHLPTGADEVLITKQRNGPVGYKPIALLPSLRFKDRWL